MIEAARAEAARQAAAATVAVWPEHWHATLLLRALSTQWHWVITPQGGHRLGLRYGSIAPVLPMVREQVPREHRQPYHELMRQLQVLEDAVLAAQAEDRRG